MKLFKLLLAMYIIVFMVSCEKEAAFIVDDKNEDTYIVNENENDIGLRQEEFDEPAIDDPCVLSNLTISMEDCIVGIPEYVTAIQQAVLAYNNIPNTGISITIVNVGNADINFGCFNGACDPTFGITGGTAAEFYDNDDETNTINVNTNIAEMANCCGIFGNCDLTGLIMHEIGHVLGLAHTGSGDGNQIDGTLVNDPLSVFNGGSLCAGICAFSPNDILAIQTMHPSCDCRPRLRFNGPRFLCDIGSTATYCVPGGFVIESWGIPSNFSQVSIDENCITLSLDAYNGNSPITVNIDENGCINSYELYVNTHEFPNFDIDYNGPICLGDVVQFSIDPLPSHQNLKVVQWTITLGGLNIMSSNVSFAVVEALISGPSQICARVVNECGREKTYCTNVIINRESDCTGDGDFPNPK